MGKGSGMGLVALLGLALLLSRDRKLTSSDFFPTFVTPSGPSITYSQYFDFATMPLEDVESDASVELVEMAHPVLDRPPGEWLTINGRIPTPRGTTIPLPTRRPRGSRIAVEKMLQPLEEAKEEPHFQDVAGRRSVNLRLKPL